MPKRNHNLNRELVAATGKQADDDTYLGKRVYGRKGTAQETEVGIILKVSRCTLDGCDGTRLHVKWPSGVHTYPCVSRCRVRDDKDLEIK